MAEHDFAALNHHYAAVIAGMPDTFTSHEFILRLAHQHQQLYIEALYSYRDRDAPFWIVHSQLARHLHDFPQLVQLVRDDVPSTDIFGQSGHCAEWRRCPG